MSEVCLKYGIPRSSLRDHIEERTRTRRMGPNTILTQEECQLVDYIQMMVLWGHPITPSQLKSKVAEITQLKIIPFKNGIPGDSWVKCFRDKHPDLVLRVPQGLDYKRARAFNQQIMSQFYTNLGNLYNEHHYEPRCIWNIDETRCQASQTGSAKVFAKRSTQSHSSREGMAKCTSCYQCKWRNYTTLLYFQKSETNKELCGLL